MKEHTLKNWRENYKRSHMPKHHYSTKNYLTTKMSELKAKRELNLLKEKEEYYLRIHNTHNENIREIEEKLSNW